MQNEIIETYLSTAWISAKNAAKVREIACKVAEFYRAKDIGTKPGISTAQAKQALCALPMTDTARAELSRRLDKYAAIASGAKCDGKSITEKQRWFEFSSPLQTVRI